MCAWVSMRLFIPIYQHSQKARFPPFFSFSLFPFPAGGPFSLHRLPFRRASYSLTTLQPLSSLFSPPPFSLFDALFPCGPPLSPRSYCTRVFSVSTLPMTSFFLAPQIRHNAKRHRKDTRNQPKHTQTTERRHEHTEQATGQVQGHAHHSPLTRLPTLPSLMPSLTSAQRLSTGR